MERLKTSFTNKEDCISNKKLYDSNYKNLKTVLPLICQSNDLSEIKIGPGKEPLNTEIKSNYYEIVDDKLNNDTYNFFYYESSFSILPHSD